MPEHQGANDDDEELADENNQRPAVYFTKHRQLLTKREVQEKRTGWRGFKGKIEVRRGFKGKIEVRRGFKGRIVVNRGYKGKIEVRRGFKGRIVANRGYKGRIRTRCGKQVGGR